MPKLLNRPVPGALTSTVTRRVREQIAAGLLAPGQCVPSERDLGRAMRVSRVTVRRGLDQLVREGLLRREAGRGYFLRDLSAPDAAKMGGATRTALVFVHNHPETELAAGTYHARMWAGAREEAARAGLLTLISSIEGPALSRERAAELAKVAAGVLCDYTDAGSIRTLLQAGMPVVQIDYYGDGLPVDAIVQDDTGGIISAVEHLHAHGHRRIGYLDTTARLRAAGRARNAEGRLSGFLTACGRLGLDPALVGPADLDAGDAAASTESLVAAGATALVVPHGELWASAREALARRGAASPGDFGVVVWGDPPTGREAGFPTSVTWSKEQMGREAARRLLLRLSRPDVGPTTIVIPTEIVDRGTGGRGPGA
jgi:DNA-binding LacI/PurR family transcriptional regulator